MRNAITIQFYPVGSGKLLVWISTPESPSWRPLRFLQLTDDARLEGFTGRQFLVAHPDGLDAQKQLQTAIPDLSLIDVDSKRHLVFLGNPASATKTLATNGDSSVTLKLFGLWSCGSLGELL